MSVVTVALSKRLEVTSSSDREYNLNTSHYTDPLAKLAWCGRVPETSPVFQESCF